VNKISLTSVIIYIFGTISDDLLTYKYVVVDHRLVEATPFARNFVYSEPLWMWFVRDFVFLAIAIAIALGYRKLILYLSRNDPPARKDKLERLASKYWVILLVVAVIRMLPGIHNTLLVVFGWESPLTRLYLPFA